MWLSDFSLTKTELCIWQCRWWRHTITSINMDTNLNWWLLQFATNRIFSASLGKLFEYLVLFLSCWLTLCNLWPNKMMSKLLLFSVILRVDYIIAPLKILQSLQESSILSDDKYSFTGRLNPTSATRYVFSQEEVKYSLICVFINKTRYIRALNCHPIPVEFVNIVFWDCRSVICGTHYVSLWWDMMEIFFMTFHLFSARTDSTPSAFCMTYYS